MIARNRNFERIVIAIDELDKLASVDDLIAVVNEFKDMLHIEGTHVIVSVSDDALKRFMLRGLPTRDVFDSTFDEIIEIPMLGLEEAIDILQKRATGFPEEWALACYILSGGLARDLLRYARKCVEIYRMMDNKSANPVARLIGYIALDKVQAYLRSREIGCQLTQQGRDHLDEALISAQEGEIGPIRCFVEEVCGDEGASMVRWLAWLEDVNHYLSNKSTGELTHARMLAKRGLGGIL